MRGEKMNKFKNLMKIFIALTVLLAPTTLQVTSSDSPITTDDLLHPKG
jgi:hypothetical protein